MTAIRALLASIALLLAAPSVSMAQGAVPAPHPDTQARLIWSTMVALDNANRTGDYSVLHALGSEGFRARHSAIQLSQTFESLRVNRIDVGRALMISPTYYIPPQINEQGQLRLRGGFEFRPRSLLFDALYVNENGGWRIHALSVAEADAR